MTIASHESSRFSGEPVNLYFFQYGVAPTEYHAYTDAEQPVEHSGVTYRPLPIDRGKISASGSLDKANVPVTTPHDCELARLYLTYPPSRPTSLIMFQGHVNDADQQFKVVWTGTVISCARKGSRAEFTCQPISVSLRRNGLRRRYQYGCPHVLYGEDCMANKDIATRTVVAEWISGSRITLAAGWSDIARAAKYQQGLAEWATAAGTREVRTILRVENAGRTFLLSAPPRGLVTGASLDLVLGCNHKSGTDAQPDGDCGPLHMNILNFGGQERIPLKNPIGLVNNFY